MHPRQSDERRMETIGIRQDASRRGLGVSGEGAAWVMHTKARISKRRRFKILSSQSSNSERTPWSKRCCRSKRHRGCWRARGRFLRPQGRTVPCHPPHPRSITLRFGRCTCWEKSGGILPVGGKIIDITAFCPPTVQPVIKNRRASLNTGAGGRNTALVSEASWQKRVEFQSSWLTELSGPAVSVVTGGKLQGLGQGEVVCLGFHSNLGGCVWNSGSFCPLD